jgi:hypothetical protein
MAGRGSAGMPMAGGAGRDAERERMRQAWMSEDLETWEGSTPAPPLVGPLS